MELQEALIYFSESISIVYHGSNQWFSRVIEHSNALLCGQYCQVEKTTLTHMQNFVQDSQGTLEFLELESQL